MKTPHETGASRPLRTLRFRLETVHMARLEDSGDFWRGEWGRPNNTLAKVVRQALTYFLSLDEADQECPRQMRVREHWVQNDYKRSQQPARAAWYDTPLPKRFIVQIPEEQHRALSNLKVNGYWPSVAEIVLFALDLWLPLPEGLRFAAEEEWMKAHDLSRGKFYERPRPYPPEGTFRTLEEHNAWRDREHPKPRPKRRIYRPRKPKGE